jgi:hypothetical protein
MFEAYFSNEYLFMSTFLVSIKGEGRKIKPGQKVHSSIAFCKENYRPKAIFRPDHECLYELVGKGSTIKHKVGEWTGPSHRNGYFRPFVNANCH